MSAWARAMKRGAWVAGVFCLLTLIALGVNAFASRASDPNPPTKVDDLVTRLNLDPNNRQLLGELRKQDVWLRSSYFRGVRFAQDGFFVLLGGIVVFLGLAKGAEKLRANPLPPDAGAPERASSDALSSHRSVFALGIGLAGVLALVATLSRHDTVASYVDGKPLPQVTPVAPAGPVGLAPAVAATAPATTSTTPAPTAAAPTPLGGTSLQPLPSTVTPTSPVATTPASVAKTLPIASAGWTTFRGSGAGTAGPWKGPADWDVLAGKGLRWKADLDLAGWNSPIIDGGRVFLSCADEKRREVCAFDLATGKNLWRFAIPAAASTVKPSSDAGYAPSTMASDGKRVFAAFVDGSVDCLSFDGKPLWSRTFGPLDNHYGYASSLLVADGKLIVQVDQGSSPDEKKSKLVALDPATGATAWEAKRAVSASWSSPIAIRLNGKTIIVALAEPMIAAYDASTGAELWHAEGISGEIAASPAFGDGKVFVAQQGSYMIAVSAADGKIAWKTSDPALPDIGSPAYGGGLVFLSTSDGTFSAIDASTGKIVWEKRIEKPARSSPVVLGDTVYLMGIDGVLRTFKADRKFTPLATHRLGEPSEATPAFVGNTMVIRGDHHLFCIGAK